MPGPREHARALDLGAGAETTAIASTSPRRPSRTAAGCRTRPAARGDARAGSAARSRAPPGGRSPRAGRAPRGSPNTAAPSCVAVDAVRPGRAGKARLDRATSAPPAPCSRRTSASASNTGTPARSNIAATVDLPIPIEPVSPRMKGRRAASRGRACSCRQQRAQLVVAALGRRRAEEHLERDRRLADQHVEPVDRCRARAPRPP